MKYKLIAIDLDGTLIDREGNIHPHSKEAIRRALDSGVRITLATGRMFQPSARYARELGISTPLICYQGALIREMDGDKVLWHKPLSVEVSREVVKQVRQEDLHLYVYIDDVLYVEDITERSQWYADRQGVKLNLVPDLAAFIQKQPSEIVAWGESANIDRLVPRLTSEFGAGLLVTKSYPTFCEIGNPESGKGNALKHLAKLLGIKREEIVAIGDGPNDISMLEYAGLGVVVGPAPAEVAAAADWAVNSAPEECLHEVIDRVLEDNA